MVIKSKRIRPLYATKSLAAIGCVNCLDIFPVRMELFADISRQQGHAVLSTFYVARLDLAH